METNLFCCKSNLSPSSPESTEHNRPIRSKDKGHGIPSADNRVRDTGHVSTAKFLKVKYYLQKDLKISIPPTWSLIGFHCHRL